MKQEVRDILEQYRIGSLKGGAAAAAPTEDPYRNEPRRHPALIVRSDKPFNGETPAQLLAASAVTPNDMFFVRHHLPVPVVDTEKFTVAVRDAAADETASQPALGNLSRQAYTWRFLHCGTPVRQLEAVVRHRWPAATSSAACLWVVTPLLDLFQGPCKLQSWGGCHLQQCTAVTLMFLATGNRLFLQVEGAGMRSLQLSVQQLQQNFKKAQVAATVQCTGNRRTEMKAMPAPGGSGAQIKGLDWDVGAISTAEWGGVLLRDVLLAAGRHMQYGLPACCA
jgi:hypothetical protein